MLFEKIIAVYWENCMKSKTLFLMNAVYWENCMKSKTLFRCREKRAQTQRWTN